MSVLRKLAKLVGYDLLRHYTWYSPWSYGYISICILAWTMVSHRLLDGRQSGCGLSLSSVWQCVIKPAMAVREEARAWNVLLGGRGQPPLLPPMKVQSQGICRTVPSLKL